jgi:hypothetical protein
MGNRQLWITCQLVMAVGVAFPALWHHLFSIVVAALLVGSTFMVTSMVAIQEAREIAGRDSTPLISAMTTHVSRSDRSSDPCLQASCHTWETNSPVPSCSLRAFCSSVPALSSGVDPRRSENRRKRFDL